MDICSLSVNGEITRSWKESASTLLSQLLPTPAVDDLVAREGILARQPPAPTPFTCDEISDAVSRCKVRKAPGLDGITGEMMKRVWYSIPDFIEDLYHSCMTNNYFPDEWKVGNVVPLLKSPDLIRSNPSSYRLIVLLPILGKVLERMMVQRIKQRLPDEAAFHASQFGFVQGRSTEDAWHRVRHRVDTTTKKYALGILVDFKGAFDNLSWHVMLNTLAGRGCQEIQLWMSFFSNRLACFNGACEQVSRAVRRGCPQGSISGTFLWNLAMDELLGELSHEECHVTAFADDLMIIIEADARIELERLGNRALHVVNSWGTRVCVPVSQRKTVCMLLKGHLASSRPPCIRLNGHGIAYSKCVKYLGIMAGERMCFRPHFIQIKRKMLKCISGLKRVLRKELGLNRGSFGIVYTGLFVACMSYGASVWYDCTKYDYTRALLYKCQRVVLYAGLNVCKTVSTEAMQVLHGALPWDLECTRRGILSRFRMGIPLLDTDPVTRDDLVNLNRKDRIQLVTDRMFDKWQVRWDACEKGRGTFRFIQDVKYVSTCEYFSMGLCLGYILTGHGSMGEYLHKRGLTEMAACICGAQVENVDHLLSECVLYQDLRDLNACGITVDERGTIHVGSALSTQVTYERLNEFAIAVFNRRTILMNEANAAE